MFIATLIAADRLSGGDISSARDRLAAAGCIPGAAIDVEPDVAADIAFIGDPLAARTALEDSLDRVDVIVQATADRHRRLIVADMDSTMIMVECIDELADYAGVKAQVAAVTEQAMRGELDFAAALAARVALLAGLTEATLEDCYRERVRVTPGAIALVRTMTANGAHSLLVTGGFTFFAERVAAEIGFANYVANTLEIVDGVLTGRLIGAIVDAEGKRAALQASASNLEIGTEAILAIGDGANDRLMVAAAGLGIGYHPRDALRAVAGGVIVHNDLSALLYAQGYARRDWVTG